MSTKPVVSANSTPENVETTFNGCGLKYGVEMKVEVATIDQREANEETFRIVIHLTDDDEMAGTEVHFNEDVKWTTVFDGGYLFDVSSFVSEGRGVSVLNDKMVEAVFRTDGKLTLSWNYGSRAVDGVFEFHRQKYCCYVSLGISKRYFQSE